MKIRPAALFSFCALIFFIVWVYEAQEWRLQARLYPWTIGIPMVVLAIIQVILDLRGYQAKEPSDGAPPVRMDFQFTKGIDASTARKRAIVMFSWFLGFFFLVWLVGFNIGIPVMVFSYLKIQSKEPLRLSIILTVIAFVFFYVLFVKLLTLPFPEGRIFGWLGID
ncbi:MAG TPA: tripartite tricarboxylate transporter TctB family protein [Candidatus Binatia bacterium]|nr:tripartite tricarboxylate transporter TctB family protein [Candidatus Binatia bacterium]